MQPAFSSLIWMPDSFKKPPAACKGLGDQLFDQSGFAGAKEAGENIDLGHSLKCLFLLCRRRKGAAQQARRALQAVRAAEC